MLDGGVTAALVRAAFPEEPPLSGRQRRAAGVSRCESEYSSKAMAVWWAHPTADTWDPRQAQPNDASRGNDLAAVGSIDHEFFGRRGYSLWIES